MRQLTLRRQSIWLIAGLVLVMLILALAGLFDGAELTAVNRAFQLRGRQTPESNIVVVAIDENSFGNTLMQWPWPRTYFAQMVDRLKAGGAKYIAFDIFFPEPEQFKPATYTFQGETLAAIADRYGVPLADLAKANGMESGDAACGGQPLTIPTNPPQQHLVLRDNLEGLAGRYQVELETLLQLNNLKNPCAITPGSLVLFPIRGAIKYTVVAGDDVARVSGFYQVNALAILDDNGQPARDPLTVGQSLTVQFGDAALAAAMKAAGNVILNGEIRETVEAGGKLVSLGQPIAPLREAIGGFGITNIQRDADGAVHSIQAWNTYSGEKIYSWPIVAASLATGQPLDADPGPESFTLGARSVPLDAGFLRVNFRGPEGTIRTVSALQVVNGDAISEDPNVFKDKVIFIGATAASLQDLYPTPFGFERLTSGVELMANAYETTVTGDTVTLLSGVCASPTDAGTGFLRLCSIFERGMMLLSIIVSGLLGLGLLFIRQPTRALGALLGLIVTGAGLWLAVFMLFSTEIPLVAPLATLFAAFAVPAAERAASEEFERRRVKDMFSMFISKEMVDELVEKGITDATRGKRVELTVLFSDIRGFTTMSEKMSPDELVAMLNEYLGAMTDVIHEHGGTVDKYEGDLVMAFFGAPVALPDHAERAVRCAIDMRLALDRLRQKWAGEGKPSNLEMGIGLNTADVFVGLVGSGQRVNYTVMGDGVNLASRVQDLTKDLKWPLLITEFTYERVKDKFDIEFAEARLVKGKTVPVGMYRVLGEKGAAGEQRVRALFA
ncbi:MAG: CHASE2 domain-containing protein [Anaerolineales bacterium]